MVALYSSLPNKRTCTPYLILTNILCHSCKFLVFLGMHFSSILENVWHFSAFLGISQHFSAFLGISRHFSAFLGISRHFLAFLGTSWHFLAFLVISWHFLAFLGISWHFLSVFNNSRQSQQSCHDPLKILFHILININF